MGVKMQVLYTGFKGEKQGTIVLPFFAEQKRLKVLLVPGTKGV